jgi:hypothetical protein
MSWQTPSRGAVALLAASGLMTRVRINRHTLGVVLISRLLRQALVEQLVATSALTRRGTCGVVESELDHHEQHAIDGTAACLALSALLQAGHKRDIITNKALVVA